MRRRSPAGIATATFGTPIDRRQVARTLGGRTLDQDGAEQRRYRVRRVARVGDRSYGRGRRERAQLAALGEVEGEGLCAGRGPGGSVDPGVVVDAEVTERRPRPVPVGGTAEVEVEELLGAERGLPFRGRVCELALLELADVAVAPGPDQDLLRPSRIRTASGLYGRRRSDHPL